MAPATTFFTTLLKSPIFWIAAAIGIVVAAIYRWIQAMGGIKVAWLTVVNALLHSLGTGSRLVS